MPQADLFAPVCPNCKGEGQRLLTIHRNAETRGRYRMVVLPIDEPLKIGDMLILPPARSKRSAIWTTHKLIYRGIRTPKPNRGSHEYTPCGRCRGTGHLRADWERQYQRWLKRNGLGRSFQAY